MGNGSVSSVSGMSGLKKYFPMLQERKEVLTEIRQNANLKALFESWKEEQQEEFLNIVTGVKGVKMLYDSFFKEIMNPEYDSERLADFLTLLLGRKVKILRVLPNDSTRIADESSLLIMDIVVELEDGSIANIEVQKIGYLFPGQRSACYSADLLLRQYKRVKGEKKEAFHYKDIQNVYTIVLFEKSPRAFKYFPETCIHFFEQKSDTGLELGLLQKYLFIPLDIFREKLHNKGITNDLDAWLTFLAIDEVEYIGKLIEKYPKFRAMYEDVYEICQNVERVMGMFSKELLQMDKNTVQYMIDEMQDTIDAQKNMLDEKNHTINEMMEQSIQTAVNIMQELNTPESEIIEQLKSKYQLTEEQAKEYIKK